MPAPRKVGLDYFPHYPGLLNDQKLSKIKMKYGSAAVVAYMAILEIAYSQNGYYVDYTDPDSLVWLLLDYVKGKYAPGAETVRDMISDMVDGGLFDADQFMSGTITSKRMQVVYYRATADRAAPKCDFSKWLLKESEMEGLSSVHPILKRWKARTDNAVNRTDNAVNRANYSQSTDTVTITSTVQLQEQETGKTYTPAEKDFKEFWNTYPGQMHRDIQAARAEFRKACTDAATKDAILDGLRRWKESEEWHERGGKFIPKPANWLAKRRWEDSVRPHKASALEAAWNSIL